MTTQRIHQVDAFTDRPFAGNPAGVCVLARAASEDWMRNVAREMNLAETSFLWPEGEVWRLRWFTPRVEIDLCGHGTLAAAHVLWETGVLAKGTEARFETRSGRLTASGEGDWIQLDFPAIPVEPVDPPAGLLEALGARAAFVGRGRFDYLVEVGSELELRRVSPDFSALRRIEARGVIVTSRGDTPEFDCVSRFFAPQVGIDEDPVTGSAHCMLAPYWAGKLGKNELKAYQASERGGVLGLRLRGDRVLLRGNAVTVITGDLRPGPE
jgi:PhzF family phenazine biosynthesis protein